MAGPTDNAGAARETRPWTAVSIPNLREIRPAERRRARNLGKDVEAVSIAQKEIKVKRPNGAGTMPVSVWTVCDLAPPAPAAEPKTQAAVVPSL